MYKPRWSSLGAALLLMGLSLPLGGGCDSNEPAVKIYHANDEGIAECKADHPEKAGECEIALRQAGEEHEVTVKHYTIDECHALYGANGCVARDNGSYFVPAMAGFMLGAMAGNAFASHPVYVNSWGQAYYGGSYLGYYRPGTHVYISPAPNSPWVRQYHVTTINIPKSTPYTPPTYSAPGRIERGGVGGAASINRSTPAAPHVTEPSGPKIDRGGLGGSQAVSKPPAPSPAHLESTPPPAKIDRGGMGGSAAVSRPPSPPSAPPPSTSSWRSESSSRPTVSAPSTSWHSESSSRASTSSSSSISRGGMGSSSSSSTSSG